VLHLEPRGEVPDTTAESARTRQSHGGCRQVYRLLASHPALRVGNHLDAQQLPDEPWAKVQVLLQPAGWWPLLSKADNSLLLYHGLHALLRTLCSGGGCRGWSSGSLHFTNTLVYTTPAPTPSCLKTLFNVVSAKYRGEI